MGDLISRLESLLRGYAEACDESQDDGGQLVKQFRRDLRLLVAQYGANAVEAGLDNMPDEDGSPVLLH